MNRSDPRGYLDRLAATVEELGAARLLQAVITLADEMPKLTDAELRDRLLVLADRATPLACGEIRHRKAGLKPENKSRTNNFAMCLLTKSAHRKFLAPHPPLFGLPRRLASKVYITVVVSDVTQSTD